MNPPPPTTSEQPFAGLTPDTILDAVHSAGLMPDGRLLALNSYENRVYQIGIEDAGPMVVKFYRPGRWSDQAITEEHEFTQALADADIPAVPPIQDSDGRTIHRFKDFRFTLFPRQGGRAPELDRDDTLEWVGRLMGRIHAVGQNAAFKHRPTLNLQTFGIEAKAYLLDHHFIPADLLPAWRSVIDLALQGIAQCYERAGDTPLIRTHGDCHPGNILWTDHGPHFVDFDDARMAPAIQDLWMLLSGDRQDMTRQLGVIVDAYEAFMAFDHRQLHLIEALRTLRLIHYSAWLAQRWGDPAFPVAFPWFNTQRYWQDRILELREQVALMQEPPLVI